MSKGRTSLSEIMGKAGAASSGKLSLSHLPDILGDAIPEMPPNPIGKHRLVTALKQRFGEGFRNIPGVAGLITEFDEKIKYEQRLAALKQLKYTPKART